ncbi:MAG: hypothetical protein WC748_00675 [Legionellales bacterium]
MLKIYLYRNINNKALILLLNIMILILLYFLLLGAKHRQVEQQELSLSRVFAQLTQQELEIKKLSDYTFEIKQLEQEWEAIQAHGLTLSQINLVFTNIESIAKQAGVSLAHINVDEFITVTLESDYISLLNFLEKLKKHPYFLLNDLQLKRDAGLIMTTLQLHILLADNHE